MIFPLYDTIGFIFNMLPQVAETPKVIEFELPI